eukprot:1737348-Pyramimonas_sp.AAC.1
MRWSRVACVDGAAGCPPCLVYDALVLGRLLRCLRVWIRCLDFALFQGRLLCLLAVAKRHGHP